MLRTSRLRGRLRSAITVAAFVAAAGCASPASTELDAVAPPALESIASGHDSSSFPAYTVEDLVTYADHAVALTVVGSRALEFEQLHPSGAGRTNRAIELRIDSVLWSSPSASPAPSTLDVVTIGWVRDGRSAGDIKMTMGRPWMQDGHSYFAMLYRISAAGPVALTLGPTGALLPMDDGIIGQGEYLGEQPAPQYTVVTDLAGVTAQRATEILREATPDPRAAPYMGLPADQRFAMVAEGQIPGSDPVFPEGVPVPVPS